MNGKSISPYSLTMPTSEVVAGGLHLLRAAAQRRLLLHLAAELRRGNSRILSLPPLFGDDLSEFLHAEADRMVGVVEVTPADRTLLDLGTRRDGKRT